MTDEIKQAPDKDVETDDAVLEIELLEFPSPASPVLEVTFEEEDEPLPALDSGADYSGAPAKGGQPGNLLVRSLLVQMLLAGALGGLLGWLAQEPGARAGELGSAQRGMGALLLNMGAFGAVMGGAIGLCVSATEWVVAGAWRRAGMAALAGLLAGAVGGGLGGVLGQGLFTLILPAESVGFRGTAGTVVARALGWALVGSCVGVGPGLVDRNRARIANGVIGGLAGGFVGGLLFDPVGLIFADVGGMGGTPSRLIGAMLVGMCAGVGVGLVEESAKEAWLVILAGPLTGKQFIVHRYPATVGRGPGVDISLSRDKQVGLEHFVVEREGGRHRLRALSPTRVNGRPARLVALTDGDRVELGQTALEFRERALRHR